MTACVICPATTADERAEGWSSWTLPEDIRWRSTFGHDGAMEPTPAGRYEACPDCTPWIPRHRAGAMPSLVQQGIHAAVTAVALHPTTRRQLHAELVGQVRHLASQLQPAVGGMTDRPDASPPTFWRKS